jgi:hypothetical protein
VLDNIRKHIKAYKESPYTKIIEEVQIVESNDIRIVTQFEVDKVWMFSEMFTIDLYTLPAFNIYQATVEDYSIRLKSLTPHPQIDHEENGEWCPGDIPESAKALTNLRSMNYNSAYSQSLIISNDIISLLYDFIS